MHRDTTADMLNTNLQNSTRVLGRSAASLSELAASRGIEHKISVDEHSDAAMFQFTTDNAKLAFESLARVYGYELLSDTPRSMLDAVVEGYFTLDDSLSQLAEKVSITTGMKNALGRSNPAYVCSDEDCGLKVPHYHGRYPSTCSNCGSKLVKYGQEQA